MTHTQRETAADRLRDREGCAGTVTWLPSGFVWGGGGGGARFLHHSFQAQPDAAECAVTAVVGLRGVVGLWDPLLWLRLLLE